MKSEPSARRIARLGLLTAAALILSLLDGMIPLPLPWLKLGLANAVTLLLLLSRRRTDAVLCLTARILLGALLLAGLLSGMLIGALTAVLFPRFSPYL